LKPTYTWQKVPLPNSFPFFDRFPGLEGLSLPPGLHGHPEDVTDLLKGDAVEEDCGSSFNE